MQGSLLERKTAQSKRYGSLYTFCEQGGFFVSNTTRSRQAWKQPSFEDSVAAHWSRKNAPYIVRAYICYLKRFDNTLIVLTVVAQRSVSH